MILQPWSKGILTRQIGDIRYATYSVSARATISLTVGPARIGSRARADLPLITVSPVVVNRNVNARASIGISLSTVRHGIKVRASLPLLTSLAKTTKQNVVHARAQLPALFTNLNRIRARARLPILYTTASVSSNTTYTDVAWVTNLTLEETTKFTNFGFLNVVRLGNTIYGVKSNGFYELDSLTTDNGTSIVASVTTHPQNFKQMVYKRIPYMYVQTPNPVVVTSYVDSTTIGPMTTDHGQQKVTMSKGTQGYYWSFNITNVSGNQFKLDGIEPFIDFLKRRA